MIQILLLNLLLTLPLLTQTTAPATQKHPL
jgi:hypothetical protein